MHVCIIYVYIYIYTSLSVCMYIYIYIYIVHRSDRSPGVPADEGPRPAAVRTYIYSV